MGQMMINPKQWLFSDKKRIAITISIILIIVIAIVGTSTVLNNSSSSAVTAVILVDNEIIRIDEIITFDAGNSSGNIQTYSWDFGDGSVSDEIQPTHQYERTGWYNVTLLVVGSNGDNDTANIQIGVQYPDEVFTRNLDRLFKIRGEVSITNTFDVGPNIGDPTLDIGISLNSVVGNFFVVVYIFPKRPVGRSALNRHDHGRRSV